MNNDPIYEAKRRLPLPALMEKLGYGDHAQKSARCPFHEDAKNSFSVYQNPEGLWRFNCFAGCGHGDEIHFLERTRKLSKADAIRFFLETAGLKAIASGPPSTDSFDWNACVASFLLSHAKKLASWRGYSVEFVACLHERGLVGLFGVEHIAFPVQDENGEVVGCHYRLEDGSWRYYPKDRGVRPLVIGDLAKASSVLIFESQWDAAAVMDQLGWHKESVVSDAIVITRGASNGKTAAKLISKMMSRDSVIYAWPQNDPINPKTGKAPAEEWLRDISLSAGRQVRRVATPKEYKDVNEWIQSGARGNDIRKAILTATAVGPREDDCAESDLSAEISPEEEQTVVPFPTSSLPPVLAEFVSAIAKAERVPEALPGCCVLAAIAAAIGTGLDIQSGPDQRTRGNIYVLATADSGSGKSKIFRQVMAPLFKYEGELIDHWKREVAPKNEAQIVFFKQQIDELKKDVRKDIPEEQREELIERLKYPKARLEELKKMATPRLVLQDATVEVLVVRLAENNETLVSASADARKLVDNLLGRNNPGRMVDDSVYLQAFSGDYIAVDRQSRETVTLHCPCLTLCWLVQPDILDTLLNEASLQAGGFLARLLLTHTMAVAQPIVDHSITVGPDVRQRWERRVTDLLVTYRKPGVRHTIAVPDSIWQMFREYHNRIVARLSGELADVKSYAMRWTEQAWRLAVGLQAGEFGKDAHSQALTPETAKRALTLADWFAGEQLNVLARGRYEARKELEDRVLKLLDERWERHREDWITHRRVQNTHIARTADEARALLNKMEAAGVLVREEKRREQGGHIERRYRLRSGRNPVPG
jgi:hypothetical protein